MNETETFTNLETTLIPSLTEQYKNRFTQIEQALLIKIPNFNEKAENRLKLHHDNQNCISEAREEIRILLLNYIIQYNNNNHRDDDEKLNESEFVKYGLDSNSKARFIINLIQCGFYPTLETLKLAIYGEANYGSYYSAEMLLILTLKLKNLGYFQLDNEWNESLLKMFNSIIRISPKVSLALYYFEMAKHELPNDDESFKNLIPSLIYNIGLSIPNDFIIENDEIQKELQLLISLVKYFENLYGNLNNSERSIFENVLKVVKYKIELLHSHQDAYNMDNISFNEISNENDDLQSIISIPSSTSTSTIEILFSKLAESSMNMRNISIQQVKSCLKHGDSKASKHVVKSTDHQLIVFYVLKSRIPYITNIYKYKSTIDSNGGEDDVEIINLLDALLSSVIYGEGCGEEFDELCEKIKQVNEISQDEREVLSETLRILFIDALPTYEQVLTITKLMIHHSLVYPMNHNNPFDENILN